MPGVNVVKRKFQQMEMNVFDPPAMAGLRARMPENGHTGRFMATARGIELTLSGFSFKNFVSDKSYEICGN